jgi:hypothetical protein
MKKVIVSVALLLAVAAQAQVSKIPVGKKMEMVSDSKMTVSVSVMGQDMQSNVDSKSNVEAVVKSVEGNAITSTVTLKRTIVKASGMGQEATLDSDDKAASSNPMAAEALKNINKPEDIVIESGKVKSKLEISTVGVQSNSELAKQFYLLVEPTNIKLDYKWTDEYNLDGTKVSINYIITKISAEEVEVTGITNLKLENTVKQMGMDMKQNLSGTTTTLSVYDAATNILKASVSKSEMSGTTNAMGMDIPMTMKIITTTTVK